MADAEMAATSSDSKAEGEEQQPKITDPKLFKSTLCQFYLKGPCKNGENCSYAHGTSELRAPGGESIADLESSNSGKKILYKTTLCAKFVTYGECSFGPGCNFAHGVKELRQALEASTAAKETDEERCKNNPAFKTSLCKNYMMGLYCQFADKCQYAHGRHELREKPAPVPPSSLPEEVKKRLAEKAKKLPGYKTKMCNNYENEGVCQYEEMCHYAHGEEELRNETDADKEMAVQMKVKRNPYYKTIMCKSLPDCQFAENCVYAHSEDEIRPLSENMSIKHGPGGGPAMMPGKVGGSYKSVLCKNFMESGNCDFGPKCTFAHGSGELRGPMDNAMGGPNFKTKMCSSVYNRTPCAKGMMCKFAHGPQEMMRGHGVGPTGAMPMGSQGPNPNNVCIQGPDGKIKFKTTMCNVFMEQGYCPRGDMCSFAHSAKQLLEAQARDPKYKTALCEAWKADGHCERGNNCIYAHGQKDLRSGPQIPMTTAYPARYSGLPEPVPASRPFQNQNQSNHPLFKTSMCIDFAKNGYCERMNTCRYAHGPQELRGGSHNVAGSSGMNMNHSSQMPMMGGGGGAAGHSNYKTAMCKNMLEQGVCSHGSQCNFAHSTSELRAKKPGPGMMMMGGGVGGPMGGPFKRKRDLIKTVMCTNYSTFGECQYGESCTFAHGPEELAMNKKQRL